MRWFGDIGVGGGREGRRFEGRRGVGGALRVTHEWIWIMNATFEGAG